jgi:L-lysine exporter family protein LysE/ArgO
VNVWRKIVCVKPFWAGSLLSLSLCLDLGIVNVAVIRVSLQQGGRAGVLVGLGSCLGDLIYFTLALFGAAALLEWTIVRWAVWAIGSCVLAFLTWRTARDAIHPKKLDLEEIAPLARKNLLFTGLGLALASPTAILWFAAVGGSVIASFGRGNSSLWAFGAGFAAAGVAWAIVFAHIVATLRMLGDRVVRVLSAASAILFLYFAIVVFADGLKSIHLGR